MAFNAALAYNENRIMTASPEELTLMLYEGAIKFCNIAVLAIDTNDIKKAHVNIVKAENIINELRRTLNVDYPISDSFEIMYEYMYHRLIEANISKSKEIIDEVLRFLREMRDTWKEAIKLAKHT